MKNLMVKMICEMEILPINGFPKKKMPLTVGVKIRIALKNCIFSVKNHVATKKVKRKRGNTPG